MQPTPAEVQKNVGSSQWKNMKFWKGLMLQGCFYRLGEFGIMDIATAKGAGWLGFSQWSFDSSHFFKKNE